MTVGNGTDEAGPAVDVSRSDTPTFIGGDGAPDDLNCCGSFLAADGWSEMVVSLQILP